MRAATPCSRRALWLAIIVGAGGCTPGAPTRLEEHRSPEASPRPLTLHSIGEGRRVFVLLHGYRARGDDLVPLGRRISERTGYRVLLPEAPLELGSGRAWYDPPRAAPRGQLDRARAQVRAVLERAGEGADRLVLGGFSQGAALSADLALTSSLRLDGLVLFSGAPLPSGDRRTARDDLPVLISHGSADPVVPFSHARALERSFTDVGAQVRFVPFSGGHAIPEAVIEAAIEFLRAR